MMGTLTNVGVLKAYFDNPKLSMDELKKLTKKELADLADLAAPELRFHRVDERTFSDE